MRMKKGVLREALNAAPLILVLAAMAALAACEGGTFADPGAVNGVFDGSGGSGTGGSGTGGTGGTVGKKPTKLSSSATYAQVIAKLDEIIAYCDTYYSGGNEETAAHAKATRKDVNPSGTGTAPSVLIGVINGYIDQLE